MLVNQMLKLNFFILFTIIKATIIGEYCQLIPAKNVANFDGTESLSFKLKSQCFGYGDEDRGFCIGGWYKGEDCSLGY